MRRAVVVVLGATALPSAQERSVWTQGAWSVQAPAGSNCGSLPLLQLKGPGSVFDTPNAPILAAMQKDLPNALSKVCPDAREVILMSGRTRRLVRLAESTAASVEPVASRPATPSAAPVPVVSSAPTPSIANRSDLRSLASVKDIEDRCEILLNWLESSKIGSKQPV
jgi:hypothetical protein